MPAVKFSIIITCYNQARMIREAVDSALRQYQRNREIIVVDDASTDNSSNILGAYGNQIRLLHSSRNRGPSRARNLGAFVAAGDYLAFLDGDDALQPWALTIYQRLIEVFRPKLILASLHWCQGILPASTVPIPKEIEFVTYKCWACKDRSFRSSASALVIERAAFEAVNGWPENLSVFEDQYLQMKLAYAGRAVRIVSPATVLYRVHQTNITHDPYKMISGSQQFVAAFQTSNSPWHWGQRLAGAVLVGGPALWAFRRAWDAGLYQEAWKLLRRAWPQLFLAALARLRAIVFGRRPVAVLTIAESSRALQPALRPASANPPNRAA